MTREAETVMKWASLAAPILACASGSFLLAQDLSGGHGAPIPLAAIVAEAENNNSQIAAAGHAWRAAAGFSNNAPAGNSRPSTDADKHSSADAAQLEAATQRAEVQILRSNIVDRAKTIYLRLAYLYQMYDLDDRGTDDLAALIQSELSKYGQGLGAQSEALDAQLARTRLLRQTTQHHEEVGGLQAELKGLLHRDPDSPDIIPETTSPTKLKMSASELLTAAGGRNPILIEDRAIIDAESARLDSIKRGVKLDSAPGFLLRHTGTDAPDNYVLVPVGPPSSSGPSDVEIARAGERLASSRSEESEDRLRQLAEVEKQYTIAISAEILMRECKEGLIPQSRAVYESKLAAYQSDRERFGAVIQAFLGQIEFEDDYLQALLEHETALAHLEALTGEKLR